MILLSKKAKRLITQLTNAARMDETKGGGDPASIPWIEANLKRKRAALNAYIAGLEVQVAVAERKPSAVFLIPPGIDTAKLRAVAEQIAAEKWGVQPK